MGGVGAESMACPPTISPISTHILALLYFESDDGK